MKITSTCRSTPRQVTRNPIQPGSARSRSCHPGSATQAMRLWSFSLWSDGFLGFFFCFFFYFLFFIFNLDLRSSDSFSLIWWVLSLSNLMGFWVFIFYFFNLDFRWLLGVDLAGCFVLADLYLCFVLQHLLKFHLFNLSVLKNKLSL